MKDTVNHQIAEAQTFLNHTSATPLSPRPPSVLLREAAEARRLLAALVKVMTNPDVGWMPTIEQAFRDAIAYRDDRASRTCGDCEVHPDGICDDHREHVDQAEVFKAVAAALGLEV